MSNDAVERDAVEPSPAEWRETVEALSDALREALEAIQDGRRGVDLLPVLKLANEAADKRDAVLGRRS